MFFFLLFFFVCLVIYLILLVFTFMSHVYLLQGPEMLSYQPNSESCLIGCYNTEEAKNFHRQQVFVLLLLLLFCALVCVTRQRLVVQGVTLPTLL